MRRLPEISFDVDELIRARCDHVSVGAAAGNGEIVVADATDRSPGRRLRVEGRAANGSLEPAARRLR
jgi:hypothetical protein